MLVAVLVPPVLVVLSVPQLLVVLVVLLVVLVGPLEYLPGFLVWSYHFTFVTSRLKPIGE